ncbi:MAG TPA: ketopantoate reductase family protein [Bacillota bacterium]
MKTIRHVYLSGLGAIGSAFAGKLFDLDPGCLTVLADDERIKRYTRDGVAINGKHYPFHYLRPEEESVPADLILIAVKNHHLSQAIQDIRKFVREDTIILSLLNGIVSEEIIGREYGLEKLLYSFVVGTDAVRKGTHTRFSNIGKIVFGERSNSFSPKVAAVKELFDRAQIPYQIPEDMLRELWWKFMMNVGVNQVSAVLKAPYGVFQKVREARELMEMASNEVVVIAARAGINLSAADIEKYIMILDTLAPEGKTSMLQDVEAGRKTEVEIFAGTIMDLGRRYGVPTPVNEILFRQIRVLEQAR